MASIKTNHEGIYLNQDAKKNPYWFQIMVNGKRVTRRGFKSIGDAKRERSKLETELSEGDFITPSKLKYADYFMQWVNNRDKISDSTKESYLSYFKIHINPLIGNITLSSITKTDIETLVREVRAKGLADETVKRIYSTVNACLNYALKMDIISKNPADIPEKPQVERVEREVWAEESIRNVLISSKGISRYWIANYLAVATGMRQGEILGLQWTDIDFEKKIIQVRRMLQKNSKKMKGLKTVQSRRSVAISDQDIAILLEQKEKIEFERECYGEGYVHYNLVVPNSKGAPALATRIQKNWNSTMKKYKPEYEPFITFHDLRHQHASMLMNLPNPNIKTVSERLGHSTVTTTLNIYSHLLPNAQHQAAMKLEKVIDMDLGTTMMMDDEDVNIILQ